VVKMATMFKNTCLSNQYRNSTNTKTLQYLYLTHPFWRTLCGIAASLVVAQPASVLAFDPTSTPASSSIVPERHLSVTSVKMAFALQDSLVPGTYIYGEVAQPAQTGRMYLVFEVSPTQEVVGAFYAPLSSFDCFHGRAEAHQLNLMVTNSYSQETYPYQLNLQKLHALAEPTANDQRLLSACKVPTAPLN
jgi:hypothetical protein